MSAWVSFEEIKKAVSLKMVLDHYGVELRPSGTATLRGKCPLPMHGAEHKNKASFTATLTKGVGGVWACRSNSCVAARGGKVGGNALDFAATMEKCSIRDAAVKMQEWFGVTTTGRAETAAKRDPEPENPAQLISEKRGGEADTPNKPLTFVLASIDQKHPYLKERGITEETAREFGVGFFSGRGVMSGGRIVFPIHNKEGELVGYAGRAIDGTEPRYKFPPGFRKSQELFNLGAVRSAGSIVLVEGFFDCMKVWQAGYLSAALMGSTMSRAQEDLIAEHFGEVILMFDGDEAGRKATEEIEGRLQRRVFRVMTINLPVDVQPDQLSDSELESLLGAVVSWTRGRGVSG